MIRCLITDGTFATRPSAWLAHVEYWLQQEIELLQIRERDLSARDLAELTRAVLRLPNPHGTQVLVNDRADVAVACGAAGVHLRDKAPRPALFRKPGFLVTVSCHKMEDAGETEGADYVLLAPIFSPLSKQDSRPVLGTAAIAEFARHSSAPVLALGGITHRNAQACVDAGAAGIAGIAYFGR
ncbi:MAG: thiamine phosphate synthase [Acidobacteriota bacterium]|nr:thiamine phosphate synthase [Acidobacteriota bacterium]